MLQARRADLLCGVLGDLLAALYEDLASQVNAQIAKLERLLKDDLAAFNKLVRDQNVPAVVLKTPRRE